MCANNYIETNSFFWDELAQINFDSEYYNIDGFYKKVCSLREIEKNELGSIINKSILHLQCHFGLDSFSLSNLGANVTGVDFSSKAISIANHLRRFHDRAITFICSDISKIAKYDLGKFDIVFTSYGVLVWLEDLEQWAKTISEHIKPNGFFYIIDEHPFSRVFCNPQIDNAAFSFSHLNSYWKTNTPIQSSYQYSYANADKKLSHTTQYIWHHSLSEIINALTSAGLNVLFVHEFEKTFYKMFDDMECDLDGWWSLKFNKKSIPLMFSMKARKE
jgi:SAM-dependent methyltransferase